MDHDFESKKHRYSANSYLEILDVEVALIYVNLDLGYIFIQDNASIHRAHKVREWFIREGIYIVEDWPLYSPDLNLIKHIW
jgi:hypothetical protein